MKAQSAPEEHQEKYSEIHGLQILMQEIKTKQKTNMKMHSKINSVSEI